MVEEALDDALSSGAPDRGRYRQACGSQRRGGFGPGVRGVIFRCLDVEHDLALADQLQPGVRRNDPKAGIECGQAL